MTTPTALIRLKSNPRDPNIVVVWVGRAKMAQLPRRDVESLSIRDGDTWTDSIARRVESLLELERCRRIALRILAVRGRSSRTLQTCLIDKGCAPETIEQVIQQLIRDGWLNDAAYAQSLVESLSRQGRSLRLIQSRLKSAGLSERDIERSLQVARDHPVDLSELVRKRLRMMTPVKDPQSAIRRLSSYLARRGHAESNIIDAIRSAGFSIEVDAPPDNRRKTTDADKHQSSQRK